MSKLEPLDLHHLRAASGWLELGNSREARAELDALPPALRECPEALAVRWGIEIKEKNWEQSLLTAQQLVAVVPGDPDAWVKQSYSLHELKRTQEARDQLLTVAHRFATTTIVSYNLACYACQLGDAGDAMRRLAQAILLGGKDEIKSMALRDVDLKPLWDRIREL